MTLFDRLAATATRLLDTYGQNMTVSRITGGYDSEQRKVVSPTTLQHIRRGTFEVVRGEQSRLAQSLTRVYAKTALLSPSIVSGSDFAPQVGDTLKDEAAWVIREVATERRQGVTLYHLVGLDAA